MAKLEEENQKLRSEVGLLREMLYDKVTSSSTCI